MDQPRFRRRCACGCGELVKPGNKFINGHHNPCASAETRKKRVEGIKAAWARGVYDTPEYKKRLSEASRSGSTPEVRQKRSEAMKAYYANNPDARQKTSDAIRNALNRPDVKKMRSDAQKTRFAKPEERRKTSEAVSKAMNKPKVLMKISGPNNHRWKGGIKCEPYCDAWLDWEYKQDLMERDENRCWNPDCWGTNDDLCLHHINYDKKDCRPINLITLCVSCNSRANSNRDYWRRLYEEIMARRFAEHEGEDIWDWETDFSRLCDYGLLALIGNRRRK
jgi:hypothetical protein